MSRGAVYLSGPMTGIPEAAERLRGFGFEVVSPHEIAGVAGASADWAESMRADLIEMLGRCSGIVVLPGWFSSRGALLEVEVARAVGFWWYRLEGDRLIVVQRGSLPEPESSRTGKASLCRA